MKYKAFLKNDQVKLLNAGSEYSLHMSFSTIIPTQTCPVETGGDFNLANGDVLHINERNGSIVVSGEIANGISITLESGHETYSYLLSPSNNSSQESCYGAFYDLGFEYDNGNIIKVYDATDVDYNNLGGKYTEDQILACGGILIAIIVIDGDNWGLMEHTRYIGNTVQLRSEEEIFISGLSLVASTVPGEIGIYFTRSTGRGCFGYYNRNGETIQETNNFYFGVGCDNQDGDAISIYNYGDENYNTAIEDSNNYTEQNVRRYLNVLCILEYHTSTSTWEIKEDHS